MKIKVPIITDRDVFLNLPDSDKADAYFKLVDALLKEFKPKKTSENSSISPSSDLTRPHEKNRSPGRLGPPRGHPGKSRNISDNPDHFVFIPITICPRTGLEINSESNSFQSHQILEMEPLTLTVIELQRQTTTGPDGKTIVAPNPAGVCSHDRLGPNLKKFIAFLKYELDTPWAKIILFLKAALKERLGAGTLSRIFKQVKQMTEKDYEAYKQDLRKSKIVGCDETGMHVMGEKWWLHVARNETTTVFLADPGRSHTVAAEFLGKSFRGILLSDFYGAYNRKFYGKGTRFAKCVSSHFLRHVKYAIECEKEKGHFAQDLYTVIYEAVLLKKYYRFGTEFYKEERQLLIDRLNHFTDGRVPSITPEGTKLRVLIKKYFDDMVKFLYVKELPPDNNGSERDIREIVRSRKIAGAYRTEEGIKNLAQVKSIVLTERKRGRSFWDYLGSQWPSVPIILNA
jgi:transposase